MATFSAGPPPPVRRWGRRLHRGATACRPLTRDDRAIDGLSVEDDNIAITQIVCRIEYTRRVGAGAYLAQESCDTIATVWGNTGGGARNG